MARSGLTRRDMMHRAVSAVVMAAAGLGATRTQAHVSGRVVVVGGGFAGASCARMLKQLAPKCDVTLVEANRAYLACPFSNEVVVGARTLSQQQFGYHGLEKHGVKLRFAFARMIEEKAVILDDGSRLPFDRAVVAPGIDIRFDALAGYDQSASEIAPHAWKAGPQTELLRRQLDAMADGGVVAMSVPANPYRCPPGPYERASLIAHYLKVHKPKSKLIVLDAKDAFSKQKLFTKAWAELYPDHLEWIGLSAGGKVVSVDAQAMTLKTDFATIKADVINVIPPQQAGTIARNAGLADQSLWCPIDAARFESRIRANIHVLGDAAIMGAMPKSAFAANMQAKACAAVVIALLKGDAAPELKLVNTCYSLVAPDYGISIAGVYQPVDGLMVDVPGAGGVSALEADHNLRETEAQLARGWFDTITNDVFG